MGRSGSEKYLKGLYNKFSRPQPRWSYVCKKCTKSKRKTSRHYMDTKIGKEHEKYKIGKARPV